MLLAHQPATLVTLGHNLAKQKSKYGVPLEKQIEPDYRIQDKCNLTYTCSPDFEKRLAMNANNFFYLVIGNFWENDKQQENEL